MSDGPVIQGENENTTAKQNFKVTDDGEMKSVIVDPKVATAPTAFTNFAINIDFSVTEDAVRLDNTISAVPGGTLRYYAKEDFIYAFDVTEALAKAKALASSTIGNKTAHSSENVEKGTELIDIPNDFADSDPIWIGVIRKTVDETLYLTNRV